MKALRSNDVKIYLAIFFSAIAYEYFEVTQLFGLRILASLFVILFYVHILIFLLENKRKMWYDFRYVFPRFMYLYVLVVLYVLLSSLTSNVKDIISLFFHPSAFPAFFIATIALTVNNGTFTKLFQLVPKINNINPFVLILELFFFGRPVLYNDIIYATFFEFLFLDKLKRKRAFYILILFALELIFSSIFDSRTIVFKIITVALIWLSFRYIEYANKKLIKIVLFFSIFIALYCLVFQFESTFNYFVDLISTDKTKVTDTRTFIFNEFFKSFKGYDWVAGRGYLGTYFSQYFYYSEGISGDHFNRFTIEVGILNILLKGGYILLIPFALVFIKATKVGFIENTFNTVSFRLSIFLLVELLVLGFENPPSFSIHYMMIWLLISIVLLNGSRNLHKSNA